MSSSKAATSPISGSYWLSSSRSGAWTIASSRLRLMIVCSPKSVVGILALDDVLIEIADAVPAEDHGPALGGADHHQADAGMGRQGPDEVRVQRLELLERQPVVVAGEPHEPQVAGPHDGDRRLVGGRRDLFLVEVDDAVRGLVRQRGAGNGRADALAPGDLRQDRVDEGRAFAGGLRWYRVARPLIRSRTTSPRLWP